MLLLLGGAITGAPTLRAQQKAMPAIGFLGGTSPGPSAPFVAAFLEGLSEIGYVEGRNLVSNTAGQRADMIGCQHWPPTSSSATST